MSWADRLWRHPGYDVIDKFGRNTAITTAEDIWDGGGTYVFPADTGVAMFVASAVDSAATQGLAIEVQGLDANFDLQTVTVNLDGTDSTTEVAIGTFSRVFRMKNVGDTTEDQNIIVGPTGLATVYAQITAGNSQTGMAIYTIPNGKVGYMLSWNASINRAGSATSREASIYISNRIPGGVRQIKRWSGMGTSGTSNFQHTWQVPSPNKNGFAAKTDIIVTASATAESDISSGFELVLIDKVG